jgi:circadian clock protein KaiC
MDLISTGIAGLDRMLGGGLIAGSAVLVEGVPGAGKTTLGLQFLYHGAENGEPGLILTFEEFPEQLQRDALSYGWDLRALQRDNRLRVMLTSADVLRQIVQQQPEPLEQTFQQYGVKRVLVDSLSHFEHLTDSPREMREVVYRFRNFLRRMGVTALLTQEIERADPSEIPFAEYLVDAVIRLTNEEAHGRQRYRFIEVLKSRGQAHLGGKSAFRFASDGLRVYPRLNPASLARTEAVLPVGDRRVSMGVAGLDQMLGGGLLSGTATILAGSAGVGKTLLSLQFLSAGAAQGEPGILLSIEERPEKSFAFARSIGLDLQALVDSGHLRIFHRVPVELPTDQVVDEFCDAVVTSGARNVVIDSMSSLFRYLLADPVLAQDYARSLIYFLSQQGATTVLNWEIPVITGNLSITDEGLSAVADAVVLMRLVETEGEIRRVLGILKMRGSAHDPALREYRITSSGMEVMAPLAGLSGVLSGSPTGMRKETTEEIMQPLAFIEGAAQLLQDGSESEDRARLLVEVEQQAAHLRELLSRRLMSSDER